MFELPRRTAVRFRDWCRVETPSRTVGRQGRSLQGAVVLLTGAAGALGSRTAVQLAHRGARLALVDNNQPALCRLADQLNGSGFEADCFLTNLMDDQQVRGLPERVRDRFGEVDVFISSAGVEIVALMHTVTPQEIEQQLAIHLKVPMLLTAALLPSMRQRGRGHVVIVSSMAGKLPLGGKAPYAAAKAGSIGFVSSLRRELDRTGVGVSVVIPGLIAGEGQGVRCLEGTNRTVEDFPGGVVTAERCAGGIIDCIEQDIAELMINPHTPVMLVGINAMWPRWADRLLQRGAAYDFWTCVAQQKGRG